MSIMQNLRIIHPLERWWLDLRLKCWAEAHILHFQLGSIAETSQCSVLSTAEPTCLTPAVTQWAVLHCDLNMLSTTEMLNKVKSSLTVWTARFALKALNLHEFLCTLCWVVEEHVVVVTPHTPFYSSWAVCVGKGKYMPPSWRRAEQVFLTAILTSFVCSCARLQFTTFVLAAASPCSFPL